MKTLREYIDLIESAQTVEGWFSKANPGLDDNARALMRQDRESHPDMDDYSWQIGWIYADGDKDIKDAYNDAYWNNPTIPSPPEARSFKLGFVARKQQGLAEVFAPVVALPQRTKKELTPAQEKSAERDVKLLGKYKDKDLGINAAMNRLEKFKQKHRKDEQGVAEADETSWTANSAQFRKEEDMSWTVEVTLEPRADINQGRGRRVKTQTVTAQSKDAAKKKLADYYRKNGWEVVGIKFAGDLAEGEDKVRQVNDAEYYHLKLLAKEAGVTLTGMGADKVTGDLHWQGDTRDGRRVSGTVKKVIDDNGEYIQGAAEEQLEETETDPIRRIEELFRNK